MVKAVVYEAHGGGVRFPAGPRAPLSWFQSGRNGLGSCNRFEELNNLFGFRINSAFRSPTCVILNFFPESNSKFLLFLIKKLIAQNILPSQLHNADYATACK